MLFLFFRPPAKTLSRGALMCISRRAAVESVVSATACQILLLTPPPSPLFCCYFCSGLATIFHRMATVWSSAAAAASPYCLPLSPLLPLWMDYLLLVLFIGSALAAATAAAALARPPALLASATSACSGCRRRTYLLSNSMLSILKWKWREQKSWVGGGENKRKGKKRLTT